MLQENQEAYYAAFKSKDPRFDGHFFIGVASTGIYCRPICRAKLPKPGNCSYFKTAAQAEQAGFRPCLQCRPELAPGLAPVDATASLVRRAAGQMEDYCGSIEDLAASLGCSSRHLRRAFASEYQVSPMQYLQTCRLLLAKNLLTDTRLSVLDVAMASGFGSLRSFNELFKKQYRLAPTQLRKQAAGGGELSGEDICVSLGYRPPYQWELMLSFLKARAIPGVEEVHEGSYYRTALLDTQDKSTASGWLKLSNHAHKNALQLSFSASLLPVLPQMLSRVRQMFDLYCQPSIQSSSLGKLNDIRPGIYIPGTRLPGSFDPFELCVRAVLGQQISVKAASTLARRFVKALGTPIQTPVRQLSYIFPQAKAVLALGDSLEYLLGPLGIIKARARTILHLARAFEEKTLLFSPYADPEEVILKLMEIPGIGAWTANYIAMRALGWTDAFPSGDHGIQRILSPRSEEEILNLAQQWRPWRAYAAIQLWNAL